MKSPGSIFLFVLRNFPGRSMAGVSSSTAGFLPARLVRPLCFSLIVTLLSLPAARASVVNVEGNAQSLYINGLDSAVVLDRWGSMIKGAYTEKARAARKLRIVHEAASRKETYRLTVLPKDPGPVPGRELYFYSAPGSVDIVLNGAGEGDLLSYASGGVYYNTAHSMEINEHTRDFRDWLGHGVANYHEALAIDGDLQDHTMNLSANVMLHPKLDVQADQMWSRNNLLFSDRTALYDYFSHSVYASYRPSDRIKASLGYDVSYSEYSDTGYRQGNLNYAPILNVQYVPFKGIKALETLSFEVFGEVRGNQYEEEEYYQVISESKTAGAGIQWEVLGVSLQPGISLSEEIADVGNPKKEHVLSRYLNLSKRQKIGDFAVTGRTGYRVDTRESPGGEAVQKEPSTRFILGADLELTENLEVGSYYALREGKQSLVEGRKPKQNEVAIHTKYKIPAITGAMILVTCGRSIPFSPTNSADESKARTYANGAFIWNF